MAVKTITVHTDSEGAFTYERVLRAVVHGIEVQLGDVAPLVAPDIDITDDTYGTTFLSETAIAADAVFFPDAVCMGIFKVVVTGAGASTRGRIVVLHHG